MTAQFAAFYNGSLFIKSALFNRWGWLFGVLRIFHFLILEANLFSVLLHHDVLVTEVGPASVA